MEATPRVLVVDDEPKIRRLLEQILRREGFEVSTAPDGEAAVKSIVASRPDLLITDLMMPGMSGLDLARRTRAFDAELPIVLVTGYASMETAVEALREGVSDYVTKPFSIAELKGVVGRLLENRALAVENRRLLGELRVANAELTQHRQRLTRKVEVAESGLLAANHALSRRLTEMEVLHEIGQMIATVFDLDELLSLSTRLLGDKVGVDAAAVLLLDAAGMHFHPHGVRGGVGGLTEGVPIPAGEGVLGAAHASRTPILLAEVDADDRVTPTERRTFGEGSLLVLPVPGKDRPAGLLAVSRHAPEQAFTPEDLRLFSLIANDLSVAIENARLFLENERNYIEILAALVESMEARDPYLRQHSERVRMKSREVGRALNLLPHELEILETGARLHDVGKVGIPDRILHKPGPLSEDEMAVMRSHPVIGDRIVKPLGRLGKVKRIIRNHHERWNGTGYPDGLAGPDIPLLTQIVTVTDAFDALTSNRSYRDALPRAEALSIIEEASGTYFSPLVVDVFLAIERDRLVRHGKLAGERQGAS